MQGLLLGGAIAAWAAVHSWLASDKMKTIAARGLGNGAARLYRLAYNLFSILSLAPIGWLMWRLPDEPMYSVAAPWSYAMYAIQAAAAALAAITILQTNALHFVGVAQMLGQNSTSRLATTGFYALVRHPLYMFGLIFLWFSPHMSANQLVFTIVSSAYLFVGAVLEEKRLGREYGAEYAKYRAVTPMIIPRIRLRPRASPLL